MTNTFNFSQSCHLLGTSPKTFKRWLVQAGIDANKQQSRFDPREKHLTKEQLKRLADLHDRTLPPLDEEETPPGEVTTLALAEQLAVLEQRINLVDQGVQQILTVVQETASHLHQTSHPTVLATARQEPVAQDDPPSPPTLTMASQPPTLPPTVPQTRTNTKPSSRSKRQAKLLPRTMQPLHSFAKEHGISEKAADHASKSGKITTKRSDWLYKSHHVKEALSPQGQREFYEHFCGRDGFTSCQRCPHGASVMTQQVG